MSQFSKEELDKFIKISCPSILDNAAAGEFSNQAKAWMLGSAERFVIDFNGVTEITRDFYQAIIHLKTNLKRDQKTIYSINLNKDLFKQIKADGVELAFNPIKSITQVTAKESQAPSNSGSLDVELINPFLTATRKTLEVQCRTKVEVLKPYLKKESLKDIAIAGVLNLSSNGYSGSVVLCFPQQVFLKVYENMFEEKHDTITNELEDAAAELLNIIYGMAKIELNPKGFEFQKALPTVLTGEKIKIRQSGLKPAIVIPFKTEIGQFHLEIEFTKSEGGSHV